MFRARWKSVLAMSTAIIAASALVFLVAWLALLDSFSLMQGQTPSGKATLLGAVWLSAGAIFIASAGRLNRGSELARGLVLGACLVAASASAVSDAWLGVAISTILGAAVLWQRVEGAQAEVGSVPRRQREHDRVAA